MNLQRTLKFIVNHPLNRGAKGKALGRFVRWQIASRLIGRPVALPFVEQTVLMTEVGMTGATGNWYSGLHEQDEMGFVLHALRPNGLFVDVGANVGSYTVLAAGAVGARVVSFEPHPETFARLKANIAINCLSSIVEARCCGVSCSAGELAFTADRDTTNRLIQSNDEGASITVPVVTLDEALGGRTPAIIKVDVEGHEAQVIEGAQRTFSDKGLLAVLMETNGSGEKFGQSDGALITAMEDFGFVACNYNAIIRSLTPQTEKRENTLFVRDVDAIQKLCKEANSYSLINGSI